jgi:hypothetical protein
MQGRFISAQSQLLPGVYIVNYKTLAGNEGAAKVVVR